MQTDYPDIQPDNEKPVADALAGMPVAQPLPEKKPSKLPSILVGAVLTIATLAGVGMFIKEMLGSASKRTKAATYSATVSVLPTTASLPPDGTLQVWVNTASQPLSFAHVEIPFDTTKLKLMQITVQPVLTRTVIAPDVATANTNGRVVFAVAQEPKTTAPGTTGAFELARLTFGPVTTANTSFALGIDAATTKLIHTEATEYSLVSKTAAITLNAQSATATPTIAGTSPVATRTPTPSYAVTRTPTPTYAATRTPTPAPLSCASMCAAGGRSTGYCVKDTKTCQRQGGTASSAYNATCKTRQASLCCCK